jgi:Flp pilus assembly protein TadB
MSVGEPARREPHLPARHRAGHGRPAAATSSWAVGAGRHDRPALRLVWTVLVAPLGALAGAACVGGTRGAVGGLLVGIGCGVWLARQPTTSERAQRRRLAAELPFAVDLVAAALRAGSTPDAAAHHAARAVGGPVGERLRQVAHALRLGATPDEAWRHLGDGEGARRVVRAAARSGHSGAAMAGSFARVADDLRADAVHAAEARARTAGVLVVLPLGLCFLPAFVLTGLVPVIVAVVDGVLATAPQVAPP